MLFHYTQNPGTGLICLAQWASVAKGEQKGWEEVNVLEKNPNASKPNISAALAGLGHRQYLWVVHVQPELCHQCSALLQVLVTFERSSRKCGLWAEGATGTLNTRRAITESKALVGVLASCPSSPLNHCFQAQLPSAEVCTGRDTGTGESQSPGTSFLSGVECSGWFCSLTCR